VQYATINNFKVLSTWYPREDIHKGTWKIPGTNDINQIDHIIVSKKWATDIENVRTYTGATSDSDHFLVGARLKQKITLIIRNRTECRKRWNVEKFDETDVERQYQQEVQRELQEKSPSNNIEEECTYIKETLTTSALYIIREKQSERNEEWYDQECREIIEIKQEAKLKCLQCNTRANQEDYSRKRIAAARVCCRKKREVIQRKVYEIVEHHTKNESKKYYIRIQDVTQEFKPRVNVCRDASGKILTEKEDIQRRWKEYFESVLTAMIFFTAENEDIQPSYEEVTHVIKCLKNHKAIKCLKNHKAPGTDQILAELLKKGGETLWRRIHHY